MNMALKWPPLDPGIWVKTTQPNQAMRREWTNEGWAKKRSDAFGQITGHHDSHGLCYDVEHVDGSVACYDPTEFVVLSQ